MQEGETLGSMAGVVGMDSRGSFENGFAWGKILGLYAKWSAFWEKAVRRISSCFFLHSLGN